MRAVAGTAILIGGVLAASPAGAAGADGAGDAGLLTERVAVRRVRLPVLLEEKAPGGCDAADPARIDLREDGLRLPVLHLDPGRLRTAHAILIDSSERAVGRMRAAKRAARAYVEALPGDEPALLATFDDSLLLHQPLTTDRRALRHRLTWAQVGRGARLWDALAQMVRYLASRPERTLLILLSDGCDTESDRALSPRAVIERASRVPGLAVVPIDVHQPWPCAGRSTEGDPVGLLRALAGATGGEYFAVDSDGEMAGVLRTIRERLDRERFVSYAPPPFGQGPKDRPRTSSQRWRRVKLRLRDAPGCRIRLAGAGVRLESREPIPWYAGDDPPAFDLTLRPERNALHGTLTDVVRDSGPLARPAPGGAWVEESARRVTKKRTVVGIVPPLRRVVSADNRPAFAFLDALGTLTGDAPALGLPVLGGGFRSWVEAPFLVNGRTLLAHRRVLATVLAGHPDYARWARHKVREDRLARLDALEHEIVDDRERQRLRVVRELLHGESWRPEPGELEPYLSAWLGDLPALQLMRAAEVWLAQRMLDEVRRNPSRAVAGDLVTDAERLWREASNLLHTPDRARVLGLLVPGYDPERDVVGFYRVVLPRATQPVFAWHPSPQAPLGARLLGWALGEKSFLRAMRAGAYEAVEIDYDPTQRNSAEFLAGAGLTAPDEVGPALEVRLTLVSRSDPRDRVAFGGAFSVRDLAGIPSREPVCIVLPRHANGASRPAARAVLEALAAAKNRSTLPCVLTYDPASRRAWTSRAKR